MCDRALKYGFVVLVVLTFVLPACSSSGVKGDVKVPKTPVGMTYMVAGGKVQLVKIDGPDESRNMTFLLRNKSGAPLEDLTARVLFYFEPQKGSVQAYDTDAKEVTFSSYPGDDHPVTVAPGIDADIVGWKLLVKQAATVSRHGERRGSLFLDGALECTRISDKLTSEKPSLSFQVENVGADTLGMLEFQVVITKTGAEPWKSAWKPFPGNVEPGKSVTLTPDVGAAPSGVANVLLKIQRSAL
ncbi:MAG: hypothetical protein ABFS86_04410 [Planctomycetota bacterium]